MKKIFSIILLSFCFILLVSCSNSKADKGFETIFKEVKNEFLDIGKVAGEDSAEYVLSKLFEKATFKINEVEEKGDEATVEATINAVDMGTYIPQYMTAILPLAFANATEETINKAAKKFFEDLLKDSNLLFVETNVSIQMTKKDNIWNTTEENKEILRNAFRAGAEKLFETDNVN